ncbi:MULTISPECIES: nuclear transport factor 2 family protein [Paenibacillus]|uniref:Nuclear transport factor 2 family protein n=1 Tax=Paenibacillus woosongensis TaxID=307580 RepID=A0AA95L283_9BACL|nr:MULTISPECIES: nuclear transport factor 2 family protein [Paenibacillus]WHX50021.1 nuclear transport factor 2 family protein [Paenibacillus woosongensis]GIP61312.1 hypothetical protein J15TS10_51260 [Paenibacillus woosongensis]
MNTHSENLRVECAENCGNAPKKELLRDLSIAFAKLEVDFCMAWVTDDIVWEVIGDHIKRGKADFEKALNHMNNRKVQQLHIHNIITHGNAGSVNGILAFHDQQRFAFCDVYNFRGFGRNAKIKTITSYFIQIS